MKIVLAQHRPASKSACSRPWLCNLPATTLAVICTLFAFGCGERRPTAKDPESTPPPVTTAPVLTPPTTPSNTSATTETEKPSKQPSPTGRVADDPSRAVEPIDAPSVRAGDGGGAAPPDTKEPDVPPAIPSIDTAATQPSKSAAGEEDVSAALRREVAEMERRRAQQQPRQW